MRLSHGIAAVVAFLISGLLADTALASSITLSRGFFNTQNYDPASNYNNGTAADYWPVPTLLSPTITTSARLFKIPTPPISLSPRMALT